MKTLTQLKPLILASALALVTTPALAQMDDSATPEALPAELANGLTVSEPDGDEATISFDANGMYSATDGSAGAWTMTGGFLCLSTDGGASGCTALPDDAAPGASWSKTGLDGSQIIYAIPETSDMEETTDEDTNSAPEN